MSAREVGKADFKSGRRRWDNPYLRGMPQFVEWLRGWREAEAEFLKLIEKRS